MNKIFKIIEILKESKFHDWAIAQLEDGRTVFVHGTHVHGRCLDMGHLQNAFCAIAQNEKGLYALYVGSDIACVNAGYGTAEQKLSIKKKHILSNFFMDIGGETPRLEIINIFSNINQFNELVNNFKNSSKLEELKGYHKDIQNFTNKYWSAADQYHKKWEAEYKAAQEAAIKAAIEKGPEEGQTYRVWTSMGPDIYGGADREGEILLIPYELEKIKDEVQEFIFDLINNKNLKIEWGEDTQPIPFKNFFISLYNDYED